MSFTPFTVHYVLSKERDVIKDGHLFCALHQDIPFIFHVMSSSRVLLFNLSVPHYQKVILLFICVLSSRKAFHLRYINKTCLSSIL